LDQTRLFVDTIIRTKHRHGDSWHPMVEVPGTHDESHDVERQWLRGRIFRCEQCADEIRVEIEADKGLRG
jgi:hypothetical protein